MKNKFAVFMIIVLALFMSGCYDTLKVDDQSFPVAIGIDIGEDKNYVVSLHIPTQTMTGSDNEINSLLIKTDVNNLYEVKSRLDSMNPWILNFSHVQYFIVSQDLAESGTLDQLLYDAEKSFLLKKSVVLIITKGDTSKFMEGINSKKLTPEKVLDDLFSQQNSAGTLIQTNANQFLESATAHLYDVPVAIGTYTYENEEITSKLEGCALFEKGKMVGALTPLQTQIMLIARGDFMLGDFSPEIYEGNTSFRLVQRSKPDVIFDMNSAPKAKITVQLSCELYSYKGDTYINDYSQAQKEISEYLSDCLNDLFGLCSRLKVDMLGLGRYAVKRYTYLDDWLNSGWENRDRAGDVYFSVNLKMERHK